MKRAPEATRSQNAPMAHLQAESEAESETEMLSWNIGPKTSNPWTWSRQKSRSGRDLLDYSRCSPKELKAFCIERGLQLPSLKRPKKAELIQILEKADDEVSFDRFLDLPAELRVQIYKIYFKSFRRLNQPAQPPISKVSRLIRQESLPVFYSTCRFLLDIGRYNVPKGEEKRLDYFREYRVTKGDFFNDIPEEHLRMIKNIRIESWLPDKQGILRNNFCIINPLICDVDVLIKHRDLWDNLQTHMNEIAVRPEGRRFERKDINTLKAFFLLKLMQNE